MKSKKRLSTSLPNNRPASVGVDVGGSWIRATLRAPGRRPLRARLKRSKSETLASALRRIYKGWRLRSADTLVVGSAGIWSASQRSALARDLRGLARRVRVLSDLELAREACLGGGPGILVLAGTGSVAFAKDARGRARRSGGLGPLLGDAGSAFWVGKRWLALGPEARALRFAHRPDAVRAVAALARVVLRRARADARAAAILREAQEELLRLASAAARGLHFPGGARVTWWGGMFEDARFAQSFARRLRRLPGLRPVPPLERPEDAAARM